MFPLFEIYLMNKNLFKSQGKSDYTLNLKCMLFWSFSYNNTTCIVRVKICTHVHTLVYITMRYSHEEL